MIASTGRKRRYDGALLSPSLTDLMRPDLADHPPDRIGNVWSFLPADSDRRPTETQLGLARWIFQHREALYEAMTGPGGAVARLHADPTLLAGCPAAEAEMAALLAVGQFGQVLNDLRLMTDAAPVSTPTLDFFRDTLRPAPEDVILDAGCSAGRHLWEVGRKHPCRQVGLDLDTLAMLAGDEARQRAGKPSPSWVRGSILDLPFATGCFSHAVSAVTVSVVPIRPALAELARVLRPGGQLTLTVEGPGFWRACFDRARPWSIHRLQLLRWKLGSWLMARGLDWQTNRLTYRLAGVTQFRPATLSRLAREAGFEVERCDPLTRYKEETALFGLVARRR